MLKFCLAISAHIALPGDWNEIHPCVRYEQDSFIAGAYLNSENTISFYAGAEFPAQLFSVPFNWELGLVTGYSSAPVVPFIRATYDINENSKLFIAPAFAIDSNTGALDLGVVIGPEISF